MTQVIVSFTKRFGSSNVDGSEMPTMDPAQVAGATLPGTAVITIETGGETTPFAYPVIARVQAKAEAFGRVGTGDISATFFERYAAESLEYRWLAPGETVKIQATQPS